MGRCAGFSHRSASSRPVGSPVTGRPVATAVGATISAAIRGAAIGTTVCATVGTAVAGRSVRAAVAEASAAVTATVSRAVRTTVTTGRRGLVVTHGHASPFSIRGEGSSIRGDSGTGLSRRAHAIRCAWCSATAPPVRLRHRTSVHPLASMRCASSSWPGQARMDSAK